MPDPIELIYWDACVFLDYIEGSPAWMPILDAILEDVSASGNLIIVTSTLSLVEVAYTSSERNGQLDPTVLEAINAIWSDSTEIQIVDVDTVIARTARELLRRAVSERRHLKPADAVHLATGIVMQVADFHTTDDRLQQWKDLRFPVRDPWTRRPRLGM